MNVVKGELNDHLTEGGIFFSLFDGLWVPDNVDDLCRVSFLVTLFPDFAKREWDAHTFLSCAMLLLLLLRHGFLLKGVNH